MTVKKGSIWRYVEKNGTVRIVEVRGSLIHYGKPCVSVVYVGKGNQRHSVALRSFSDPSRTEMIRDADGGALNYGLTQGCL